MPVGQQLPRRQAAPGERAVPAAEEQVRPGLGLVWALPELGLVRPGLAWQVWALPGLLMPHR